MAKFGKFRSVEEVYDAHYGVSIKPIIEGVIENIQMLRREFKKPKSQRLASNLVDHDLRQNLMGLNAVYKQLKRNENLS